MSRLNWKIKIVLLVLPLMLYLSACEMECKSVTGPTPPDDPIEEREYYDFTVTYIRTYIINNPHSFDPIRLQIAVDGRVRLVLLAKLDEYRFQAEEIVRISTHLKNEQRVSNAIYVVDMKRWLESWAEGILTVGRPYSVGDIIMLKNNQTNVETQLTKIVPNTYFTSLPPKCEPQMAQFKVLKGGIVVNE